MENQLRRLILCTICNQEFTDLKLLPCQHLACIDCLKQCIGNNKDKIVCTNCQKDVLVPNGGADGFPDSLMTRQVADVLRSSSKSETSTHGENKSEPNPNLIPVEEDPLSVKVREVMADKRKKVELWKALEEKTGIAQEWLFITQANEKMVRNSLEALPTQVKEAKQQIQEIRNTERAKLQKMIEAINAAAAKKLDSIQKAQARRETELNNYGQQLPPKIHQVRDSLSGVQQLLKSLTTKQITQDTVRKAVKKLDDLKSLDIFGRIFDWKKFQELSLGDSVRFDIGGNFTRIGEILSDDVDFVKIGKIIYLKEVMGMHIATVMFPNEKSGWVGNAKYLMLSLEESAVPFVEQRAVITTPPESASFVHMVDLDNAKRWYKDKTEGIVDYIKLSKRNSLEGNQHLLFATVVFPGMKTWYGPLQHLKKTNSAAFQVGLQVMLVRGIMKKDGVSRSCVGVLKSITGDRNTHEVVVDFPSKTGWKGKVEDITPARHPIENNSVAAKLDTDLSESKWNGIKQDQIGKVVRIRYDKTEGVVKGTATVKFGGNMVDCSLDELDLMVDTDEEDTNRGEIPFQDLQFQQAMQETMQNVFPFLSEN